MKKIVFAVALFGTVATQAAADLTIGLEKSKFCSACHGQQGISLNVEWPNLAGQHASYLIKQMQDYKKGVSRNEATMVAVMASFSEQDIADLAAFYAQQKLPEGETPEKYLQRGKALYRGGDFTKHITACIACHGPKGSGNEQAGFPMLAGQHALYTLGQLQAFKAQKRTNDLNSIMRDISGRMSEEDMEAVAYYIQGLR